MKPRLLLTLLIAAAALFVLLRWSLLQDSESSQRSADKPQALELSPDRPVAPPSPDESALPEEPARAGVHSSQSAPQTGLYGVLTRLSSGAASATVVPGARVRWTLAGLVLGETISDADGRYSLALAPYFALSELQRERGLLELEVRAAGYQPLLRATAKPHPGTTQLRMDVTLLPGNTLRSRVVDANGTAIADAVVQLLVSTRKADKPVLEPIATVRSDASGGFELGFASSVDMILYARAPNVGTAWQEIGLVAGRDLDAAEVVLRGEGELRGFARFSDGSAVADLDLWAVPEAVAIQPNALILCVERASEFERGTGLFSSACTTGSDGSFRLAGLIPGKYMLRTPTNEVVFEPRFGYYNSGTDGILLSIETQRLRIEVRDASGQPLTGAQVVLSELNDAGEGRYESGQRWFQRTRGNNANATFNVQSETAYGLRVQAAGFEPYEDLFMLAPNEFEQLQTVTLAPPAPRAKLRLVLSSPLGAVPGARVQRLSVLTGQADLDLGILAVDPEGWIEGLPPGEQCFEIGFKDSLESPNWHLPIPRTAPVNLPPGGTRELLQPLSLGARLEVELAFESAPPALPDLPAGATREERLASQGAFVSFEPEGQPEFALNFFGPDGRVESQLLTSSPGRGVELLVPSRGTLKVQAPGCFLASEAVTFAPGHYTRVRVKLRARS
jgi:protocatechuate 3,4-dioxygenase beta subunit